MDEIDVRLGIVVGAIVGGWEKACVVLPCNPAMGEAVPTEDVCIAGGPSLRPALYWVTGSASSHEKGDSMQPMMFIVVCTPWAVNRCHLPKSQLHRQPRTIALVQQSVLPLLVGWSVHLSVYPSLSPCLHSNSLLVAQTLPSVFNLP